MNYSYISRKCNICNKNMKKENISDTCYRCRRNNSKKGGNCVKCNNKLSHKNISNICLKCKKLTNKIYEQTIQKYCSSCGEKIRLDNNYEVCKKCRYQKNKYCFDCNKEIKGFTKTGKCKSCWQKGRKRPIEFGLKMSVINTGRKQSKEERKNKRIAHLKRIENLGIKVFPNFNNDSILIIEQYGKDHGYNFQHAKNDGEYHIKELGYFVDGYDKNKNVVIEYYETAHGYIEKIEKDKIRKQEIIDFLKCEFIEIYENNWNKNGI